MALRHRTQCVDGCGVDGCDVDGSGGGDGSGGSVFVNLVDLGVLAQSTVISGQVDAGVPSVTYQFRIDGPAQVSARLELLTGGADLYLYDGQFNLIASSTSGATTDAIVAALMSGTYYLQVVDAGGGGGQYELTLELG